jgi:hypothetical protein
MKRRRYEIMKCVAELIVTRGVFCVSGSSGVEFLSQRDLLVDRVKSHF